MNINSLDLALNNLQGLICHKLQPTSQPANQLQINVQIWKGALFSKIYPAHL